VLRRAGAGCAVPDHREVKIGTLAGIPDSLPAGIDPATFHTVTVWCGIFAQYIGSGALERAAAAPSS
jgi:hypothetical protein